MKRRWVVLDNMIAGLLGGLAGGIAMDMVMMAGEKMKIVETPLPLKVERKLEERAGVAYKTSKQYEEVASQILHLGLGSLLGLGFRLMRTRTKLSPWLAGPMFGFLVYRTNLAAVGPALDLTKEPWNQPDKSVTARRIMLHLLYGTVVALVSDSIIKAGRR